MGFVQWLNENEGLFAVSGILASAIGAYALHRSQMHKKQLEYVITGNQPVVPKIVSSKLRVVYNKKTVSEASVLTLKFVNTGNTPITASDFETNLTFRLNGAKHIMTASSTKTRPLDLRPKLVVKDNSVMIQPILINPSDMIELQFLISGSTTHVIAEGRLAGTRLIPRKGLPYPPGSGPEGNLLGFDKFMWYVLQPVAVSLFVLLFFITNSTSTATKVTAILGVLVYVFVLNPLYIKHLMKRRLVWG